MSLFSVGLSGRFAELCDTVALSIAERRFGEVRLLSANTLQDLACETIRTRATNAIVAARQPSLRLCSVIAEARERFIIALDDPRTALGHLVLESNVGLVDAVRAVARGCAAVASLAGMPEALVLNAEHGRTAPRMIAAAIGQHFDLELTPDELTEVAARCVDSTFADDPTPYSAWWGALDEPSLAIANGALAAYRAFFEGGTLGPITWGRDLFYVTGDVPGPPRSLALGPADITGRPRRLIFGPSIMLPPGDWHATLALSLSPEAAEASYAVEVTADRTLAGARVQPEGRTVIEIELEFAVDGTLDQPIDIQLSNERAAFDGRLALAHVRLTRRQPAESGAGDPIRQAAAGA